MVGYLEVQDYTTVEHVRPIIPHLWPQIKGGGGFTFQKIGAVTVEKFTSFISLFFALFITCYHIILSCLGWMSIE